MTFLSLPAIGSLTLNVTNFLQANPALIHQIAGDALTHALHSYSRRAGRRKGLSRREMRKTANRKRRWFVDNIIMHHKRLHDRNRAIVVSNARTRALAKRDSLKKPSSNNHHESFLQREGHRGGVSNFSSSSNSSNLRKRAELIRGRVDARKIRARSRWLSALEEVKK
jgi:hypothetical protein